MYQSIAPQNFQTWIKQNPNHLIVDVREDYEFQENNLGGINIPLENVIDRIKELPDDKDILFCCKSGKRSAAIAYNISVKHGKTNVYTLEGGIESLTALK